MESSATILEQYINKNEYFLVSKWAEENTHTLEFYISQKNIDGIDSVLKSLGYIKSKNLESINDQSKKSDLEFELNYLKGKKNEYEKMLSKIDSIKSEKYYSHWLDIRDIDAKIFDVQKKILQLEKLNSNLDCIITLTKEHTTPDESISFINMPGIEYNYLKIESPKSNLSYNVYQGVLLKYLFTKGKSYFNLGAFKALKPINSKDTLAYDELFVLSFGQDFYTKHFGRGKNKFLNLYVGYNVGGMIASNPNKNKVIPFLSPIIGTELIKTKYILLDFKTAYFLPLKDNRNMRGLSLSCSFNFVF